MTTRFSRFITPVGNEVGFYREWVRLRLSPVYYGHGIPHGKGEPVVVVPGFMGTDLSLMELYWWLARIGYRPYYSGLGLNVDCPDSSTDLVLGTVRRAEEETGERVRLIGHSLGALIARSVAFDHPDEVELLISLAAPFNEIAYVHPVLIEGDGGRAAAGGFAPDLARGPGLLQRALHVPLHGQHHAAAAADVPAASALRGARRSGEPGELHRERARVQRRDRGRATTG